MRERGYAFQHTAFHGYEQWEYAELLESCLLGEFVDSELCLLEEFDDLEWWLPVDYTESELGVAAPHQALTG